ncbi:carboxymuconolactone decarboxylase family protein [Scleromatobacter humisilvae]|uniref:Carboxymuconolactone decarboxylase family protein n=1 Tax=Scleromatobacter humisilvae TaxID=2897159 RepID=A0A9X1YJ52_9BURK|nr:carboxymuconolactone decarboxylase family protein [Scleromatobacter humisilvae]MCK9685357.1 carboxymuconolactone decarboxylase family protein [Scleromatobacter humisilvae]
MSTSHQRLDYAQQAPDLFRKYLDFNMAFRMDESLALLVDIRASQLNGCTFCLDMHVKQARIRGERDLRLHHVAVWRESPLFTPKERTALAWTESLTRLGPEGVSDTTYGNAREHFSPEELSALTFRIVAINGWNRLNAAFLPTPGAQDKMLGLDKAGLN